MLPSATAQIEQMLPDDATLLDVGGWAAPLCRATHMLDLMPYETRAPMGTYGTPPERTTPDTWTVRDFCDREPWPYADDEFDFAVCSMTLEDIRDPIWVCSELARVARAGYIEVPSVLNELTWHVVPGGGPWVGHEHHRWLCFLDPSSSSVEFMHKPHTIHQARRVQVRPEEGASLTLEEQCQGMFWEGTFTASERVVIGAYPLDELEAIVRARFPLDARETRLRAAEERLATAAAGVGGRARWWIRRAAGARR